MTLVHRVRRTATGLVTAALLSAGLALAGQLIAAAPAVAADNGAWSVTPTPPQDAGPTPRTYFVLEGAPGQVIEDRARIRNFTDKPITFKIYGADGYNTEQDGFFALRDLQVPQVDVGAWVKMPVQEVTVAGRTQIDVPFTLTIPDNATPGDHVGGVVAMNAAVEGTEGDGSFEVGLQRAVGARLYLRVAGPVTPKVTVRDVTITHDGGALPGEGKGTVSYTLVNDGNVRLAPSAQITVTGLFGHEVASVEQEAVLDLLPGQTATVTENIEGIRPVDRVTAEVVATTPEGVRSVGRTSVWVVPWPLLVAVPLLVLAGIWFWWHRRELGRRRLAAAAEAPRITVGARG